MMPPLISVVLFSIILLAGMVYIWPPTKTDDDWEEDQVRAQSAFIDAMIDAFKSEPVQVDINQDDISTVSVRVGGVQAIASWYIDGSDHGFIYDGDEHTVSAYEASVIIRVAKRRAENLYLEKREELDRDYG